MRFHGSISPVPLADLGVRCVCAEDRAALHRELDALAAHLKRDAEFREAQRRRDGRERQPGSAELGRLGRLAFVRAAIDAYDRDQATLAGTREAEGADLAHAFALTETC